MAETLGTIEGVLPSCPYIGDLAAAFESQHALVDEVEARMDELGVEDILVDRPSDTLEDDIERYIADKGGCKFVVDGKCMIAQFAIDKLVNEE